VGFLLHHRSPRSRIDRNCVVSASRMETDDVIRALSAVGLATNVRVHKD
jgi:hypothetical protein